MKQPLHIVLQVCALLSCFSLAAHDEIRVTATVSMGELLDKITILQNKKNHLKNAPML